MDRFSIGLLFSKGFDIDANGAAFSTFNSNALNQKTINLPPSSSSISKIPQIKRRERLSCFYQCVYLLYQNHSINYDLRSVQPSAAWGNQRETFHFYLDNVVNVQPTIQYKVPVFPKRRKLLLEKKRRTTTTSRLNSG